MIASLAARWLDWVRGGQKDEQDKIFNPLDLRIGDKLKFLKYQDPNMVFRVRAITERTTLPSEYTTSGLLPSRSRSVDYRISNADNQDYIIRLLCGNVNSNAYALLLSPGQFYEWEPEGEKLISDIRNDFNLKINGKRYYQGIIRPNTYNFRMLTDDDDSGDVTPNEVTTHDSVEVYSLNNLDAQFTHAFAEHYKKNNLVVFYLGNVIDLVFVDRS